MDELVLKIQINAYLQIKFQNLECDCNLLFFLLIFIKTPIH